MTRARIAHNYISTLFFKNAGAFFLATTALFLLVDYSVHATSFSKHHSPIATILTYYASLAVVRLDFFLPLACLFGTLQTAKYLATHSELVAFQVGGLSPTRLFSPLFVYAGLITALLGAHFQWTHPLCSRRVDAIEEAYIKNRRHTLTENRVHTIHFENGVICFYKNLNPASNALRDVFIIDSLDLVWHCDEYHPHTQTGLGVTTFIRQADGYLDKATRQTRSDFTSKLPPFSPYRRSKHYFSTLSLGELYHTYTTTPSPIVYQKSESALWYKLAVALLPALAVPIFLPFLLKPRHPSSFPRRMCMAFLLFSLLQMLFITFKMVGQHGITSTAYTIGGALAILLLCATRQLYRVQR